MVIENKIKEQFQQLKKEKRGNIENKINIILEANKLIRKNLNVFNNYSEEFLRESQDVLNFLQISFDNLKEKILSNNEVTNISSLITELDKNSSLIYKLTNNLEFKITFFEVVSKQIIISLFKNVKVKDIQTPSLENLDINTKLLVNCLKKVSSFIYERKSMYFKEFNDFILVKLMLYNILKNVTKNIEEYLWNIKEINDKMVLKQNKLLLEKDPKQSNNTQANENLKELDYLSNCIKFVIANFESFKFFCEILNEKINVFHKNSKTFKENEMQLTGHSTNIIHPNQTSQTNSQLLNSILSLNDDIFAKSTVNLLHDLGREYANNEIKFMKENLRIIFKEESRKFHQIVENGLSLKFSDQDNEALNAIDNLFFILKHSGQRAINTMNLQLSLAIVNHIKAIISEELIQVIKLV